MEKIGIIGGADGPTAVIVSGTASLTVKLFFALAVIVVVGAIVWVQHRRS